MGTFNLQWAFDHHDDRTELANTYNAPDEAAWKWKVHAVAEVLAEHDLDVLVLQDVGGDRELWTLTNHLRETGGPDYNFAWVPSTDRRTARQTAILTKHRIYGKRRLESVSTPVHMAAEVVFPNGGELEVVAVQVLRTSATKSHRRIRRRTADALEDRVERMMKERPVLVVGDLGVDVLPDDADYEETPAGIVALDRCTDSASYPEARETTVNGEARDRILTCGVPLLMAGTSPREAIVAGDPDGDALWHEMPESERDISDHLLLWAAVEVKPA